MKKTRKFVTFLVSRGNFHRNMCSQKYPKLLLTKNLFMNKYLFLIAYIAHIFSERKSERMWCSYLHAPNLVCSEMKVEAASILDAILNRLLYNF